MTPSLSAPLLVLLLAGCGYNASYTAQRRADDAERAARAGDVAGAAAAWRAALDAAAAAYRAAPDSRRGTASLVIAARSRLALGDADAAAAAARYALSHGVTGADRAATHAVLGSALLRVDSAHTALEHFDSAMAQGVPRQRIAEVRLQRGLANAALGRYDEAHADFDAAAEQPAWRVAAVRAAADAAVSAGDLPRFQSAFRALSEAGGHAVAVPALENLAAPATLRWGAGGVAAVAASLRPVTADGDVASHSGVVESDVAYRLGLLHAYYASRAALDTMQSPDDLAGVQAFLQPVSSDSGVRVLLRATRGIRHLLQQGSADNPLPIFAAAEMARDELAAPRLAAHLFLQFAAVASQTPWAGKAILAAHDLAPTRETVALLEQHSSNVYVRAASGITDAEELALAEERLARGLMGLREAALADRGGRL